jgi:hypothetical protein
MIFLKLVYAVSLLIGSLVIVGSFYSLQSSKINAIGYLVIAAIVRLEIMAQEVKK